MLQGRGKTNWPIADRRVPSKSPNTISDSVPKQPHGADRHNIDAQSHMRPQNDSSLQETVSK